MMKFGDLSNPAFFRDPYPVWERLRAEGPIVKLAPHMWISGRHSIVDSLLRDRRVGKNYMNSVRAQYGEAGSQGHMFQTFSRMLALMNPPQHTRLRALLMKAFNAAHNQQLQMLVEAVAKRVFERMIVRGQEADLMADFAYPLPVAVICDLLGLPLEDAPAFTKAVSILTELVGPMLLSPKRIEEGNQATRSLENYFKAKLADRRRHPGNDLLSVLATADDGQGQLSDEEIISNTILLFIAGHETTTNSIGNSLIALFDHPEALAKLRADPSLLPQVVAECLRFDNSLQLTARSALEDIEIEGVQIQSGNVIFLALGAANRDPLAYRDPNHFDINRPDEARRISFGGGLHFCLGARLANIELEVALSTLLFRLPDLQLTHLAELSWTPRNSFRGVAELKARWGRSTHDQ